MGCGAHRLSTASARPATLTRPQGLLAQAPDRALVIRGGPFEGYDRAFGLKSSQSSDHTVVGKLALLLKPPGVEAVPRRPRVPQPFPRGLDVLFELAVRTSAVAEQRGERVGVVTSRSAVQLLVFAERQGGVGIEYDDGGGRWGEGSFRGGKIAARCPVTERCGKQPSGLRYVPLSGAASWRSARKAIAYAAAARAMKAPALSVSAAAVAASDSDAFNDQIRPLFALGRRPRTHSSAEDSGGGGGPASSTRSHAATRASWSPPLTLIAIEQ